MTTRAPFRFGETIPFEIFFEDCEDLPVKNGEGVGSFRRQSDNKYWTGTVWQIPEIFLPGIEIDPVNVEGGWLFPFDTSVGEPIDNYILHAKDLSGQAALNPPRLFAYVGGYLEPLEAQLTKLLGLNHENVGIRDLTYDVNKRPLTSRLITYDTPENALINNGVDGRQESYLTVATYDEAGKMLTYNKIREVI